MPLFLSTLLAMTAFAANSVLTRWGVAGEGMTPGAFAAIRTLSGAVVLMALLARRGATAPRRPGPGALWLALYMIGFSLAYTGLDAGTGALILFGVVQLTMFGGALAGAEAVPARRWIGAGVSLSGLALLAAPGAVGAGTVFMALAGLAWGLYSLHGRGARDPLAETGWNFLYALPLVALLALSGLGTVSVAGVGLAVVSGAVTSGLGYALWYRILPALGASRAAVAQLSVPVIAALGGAVLLGEMPDARLVAASALVLGGIALSVRPAR